jgi:hypothetical protein
LLSVAVGKLKMTASKQDKRLQYVEQGGIYRTMGLQRVEKHNSTKYQAYIVLTTFAVNLQFQY